LLRLCLKNLLALNFDFDYEIIVVDNNSADNSFGMVKKTYPSIKLIDSKTNIGHAAGNNLGIKEAKGEYILLLNTDIIIADKADIKKVLNFMDKHPDASIVGPKLINGNGTIQNSCYRRYKFFTPIYRRTPLGEFKFARKDLQRHLMWDFEHNETKEVEWILGACMFIRKNFLDKYGYFDEDFFLYFADYELCDRAYNAGYKVYYYADTNIIHYHKRESAQGAIWGGIGSFFNYTTRIHLKDWFKYLIKKRQHETKTKR
jgi:GT2 family glycosyltransferase